MAAISQQNALSLRRLLKARADGLLGVGLEYVALLRLAVQSADALAGPEFAVEVIAAARAVHRWWP
jgi:hypothetical protein